MWLAAAFLGTFCVGLLTGVTLERLGQDADRWDAEWFADVPEPPSNVRLVDFPVVDPLPWTDDAFPSPDDRVLWADADGPWDWDAEGWA